MTHLFRQRLLALVWLLGAAQAQALETVTLQLKWTHAFQFAGYYAAQAQGYYREAGLAVNIVPAQPASDAVKTVLAGQAQYGVGNSNLLLTRHAGQPVVVLAVIFQHSPLVLVARKTHALQSVHDLNGKRLMFEPHSDELRAYLQQEGLPASALREAPHSGNPRDLIEGRVDAMTAYVTNEPYYLNQAHLPYQTYTSRSVGIDFYGDNLFTTEQEIADHPERVAAFRAASLRGWQYAMAHQEEIADLIGRRYSRQHPRDFYLFEARQMESLLQTQLIEVGYMNPGRWQHIAQTYATLGLLPAHFSLDGFLYQSTPAARIVSPYLLATVALLLLATGTAAYIFRINRRLDRNLSQLHASRQLQHQILQASPDNITVTDLHGDIRHISPAGVIMLGAMHEVELMGRNVLTFHKPEDTARARAMMTRLQAGDASGVEEYRLIRLDGNLLDTEIHAEIIHDALKRPSGFIFAVRDTRERKQIEERLRHMAQHDALTGLANRALFSDRLQRALASAQRDRTPLALMFLDLDKFKPVNDQYGHGVGDQLLQEAARRMQNCVRESDTVARMGGDEFVVLLRSITHTQDALCVAEKLRHSLEQPFLLAGQSLAISASIGVALFPAHGADQISLTHAADSAMYQAKEAGRNRAQLFTPGE